MTARWAGWLAVTAAWCQPVPELVGAVLHRNFISAAQHVHSTSCNSCRAWTRRKERACSRPAQMAQAHVMPPAQVWKHPALGTSPSLMEDVLH